MISTLKTLLQEYFHSLDSVFYCAKKAARTNARFHFDYSLSFIHFSVTLELFRHCLYGKAHFPPHAFIVAAAAVRCYCNVHITFDSYNPSSVAYAYLHGE